MAKKGGSRKRVQEEEGEPGAGQPVESAACGSIAQQKNVQETYNSPASSRYPTRTSKTLLAHFGIVASSRYPIRNVNGIPNQSSTLTPLRTCLVETTDQSIPTSNNFILGVPPELQAQNSTAGPSRDPIRLEKSTPTMNSMENLISCDKEVENSKSSNNFSYPTSGDLKAANNFANQFFPVNQGNEDLRIPPPLSPAPKIASQFHVGCSGQTFSLDYTQIAEMLDEEDDEVASAVDPALVTVNGYQVKEEVAPLLRSIILKHGDIAKNSSLKSVRIRSAQLEIVCAIYQKLEKIKPTEITTWEIKSILADVADLETVKLDLGWLRQRLEEISEALQYTKGYTTLKKEKTEKILQAEMHKNELEELKGKVAAIEADIEKIDEAINARRKMHLLNQPLVSGLI